MNEKTGFKKRIPGAVIALLGIVLTVGVKVIFHACPGPMESGMWMSCHWAEEAVFAGGIAITAIGLIGALLPSAGAVLAAVPAAAVTALIPGVFIKLCGMTTMRCHTAMRPAVIIVCALIAIAGVVGAVLLRKDRD